MSCLWDSVLSHHIPFHPTPILNIFSMFCLHGAACRVLVPRLGIEPMPPAVEALSLNRWITREAPPLLSGGQRSVGSNTAVLTTVFTLASFGGFKIKPNF